MIPSLSVDRTRNSSMDFSDRSVIVTSGGSGKGAATARVFRNRGANCFPVDVHFPSDDHPEKNIQADVTDAHCADEIVDRVEAVTSSCEIHTLVNAAGVLLRSGIDEQDVERSWMQTLDVNVTAAMRLGNRLSKNLKMTKGAIVNVCSIQSYIHLPNSVAYSASKGALAQVSRARAVEYGGYGIRYNGVAPSAIETPITKEALKGEYRDKLMERTPLHRVGKPKMLLSQSRFWPLTCLVTSQARFFR